LRLHPEDAQRLGLQDQALARVHNARGSCIATVVISADIRPGVAALPTGAWLTPDTCQPELDWSGNPNVLTPDLPTSRLGQGCAAYTCLVRIEPYHGDAPEPAHLYDQRLQEQTA
jgi:biotin/methionine sulfoxide reductase